MQKHKRIEPLITPLASIFGSGFLIIIPILASVAGEFSFLAMMIVCFLAYLIGHVIRYNIKNVEPLIDNGKANKNTKTFELLSDILLIPAYIISIVLYLKILASFVLKAFNVDTPINENILVSLILVIILLFSIFKGLKSLNFLEKYALLLTLIIIVLLFIGFLSYDIKQFSHGYTWPVVKNISLIEKIKIIAGTLIVVQGFETTRYLSYEYDAKTRIKACKNAQIFSTIIYVLLIFVATPITHILNLQKPVANNELILLVQFAVPLLLIPLILAAILSQFSAAIADALGASGNINEIFEKKISVKKASIIVILFATLLTWLVSSGAVVALASKAFAAYYFFQCLVAFSVAKTKKEKTLFIFLMFILLFIVFFAVPAG